MIFNEMEFFVPVYTEDLEQKRNDRFWVETVCDIEKCADVDQFMDELNDTILNDDDILACVVNEDVFSKLYSLVKYWTILNPSQQQRLVDLLSSTLTDVLATITSAPLPADPREQAKLAFKCRNAFKATSYMFFVIVQIAEKLSKAAADTKLAPKKKRGGKKAVKEEAADSGGEEAAGEECEDESLQWSKQREECVDTMKKCITMDLRKMWSMAMPEEEYIAAVSKTSLRLLTSLNAIKDKGSRRAITELIAVAMHKFPSTVASTAAGIASAIIANDFVGAVAVDLVQLWEMADGRVPCKAASSALLRELGDVSQGNQAKDSASLRRAANFLMEISEKLPHLVMNNIAMLMPFLECDSQALRSALVTALGSILVQEAQDAGAPVAVDAVSNEMSEATRDSLYEVLFARAYDVHSLTRASVLKCCLNIVQNSAIPANRLMAVTAIAVDRVKDKGALVRKAATQLLRGLIEHNPFGPRLAAEPYERQTRLSEEWLSTNTSPESISNTEERALNESIAESAAADSGEVAKHKKIVAACQLAAQFCNEIALSVPAVAQLMGSKTGSDVMESIRYLAKCRAFGVPGAEQALARMLMLIWSNDAAIKEEVIITFCKLYVFNDTLDDDDAAAFGAAEGEEAEKEKPVEEAAVKPAARAKRTKAKKPSAAAEGDDDDSDAKSAGDDDESADEAKPAKKRSKAVKSSRVAKPSGKTLSAVSADPKYVAESLVSILKGASLSVQTSLEEVLREVASRKLVPEGAVRVMWDFVSAGVAALTKLRTTCMHVLATCESEIGAIAPSDPESLAKQGTVAKKAVVFMGAQKQAATAALLKARNSMSILSMLGVSNNDIIMALPSVGRASAILCPDMKSECGPEFINAVKRVLPMLSPLELEAFDTNVCLGDYRLAAHVCSGLKAVAGDSLLGVGGRAAIVDSKAPQQEFDSKKAAAVSTIINGIVAMIAGAWDGGQLENKFYFTAAQHGIDAIFAMYHKPAELSQHILRSMCSKLRMADGNLCVGALARFFFVLGHVHLKLLILADSLSVRVKVLRVKALEARASETKTKKSSSKAEAGSLEDQLGSNAAEDEKEAELLTELTEKTMVVEGFAGSYLPIITHIIQMQIGAAPSPDSSLENLAQSALLALCKMMCISSEVCDKNLPLLFTALSRGRSASLRATVATALGDLMFRFPNLIEPYTHHLYARLRDPDAKVRKNTLMVLTHLILNGMVKVKGQVGEIAICLHDPEPRVVDLTKMFFDELSKRSNSPIYNILPDTLSCLSRLAEQAETGVDTANGLRPFNASAYKEIVQYLLSFIAKDKQAEGLADKLLHRFEATEQPRMWRDVAYCLSLLSMNDKMLKSLMESTRLYRHALVDDDVWHHFATILAKAKKMIATKTDMKDAVTEWETSLEAIRVGAVEDSAADAKARAATRRAAAIAVTEGIADELREQAMEAARNAATSVAVEMEAAKKKKPTRSAKTADGENAPVAPASKKAPARKKKVVVDSESESSDSSAGEEEAAPSKAKSKAPGLKASAASNKISSKK